MRSKIVLAIIAAAWAGMFLWSMLAATGGHLSMPLDDAYIFFQYAHRAAEGAPLSYQAGDPVTSGATSLLTVLVYTVGDLLGFRGQAAPVFALLVGLIALFWSAHSAWRLGTRLSPGIAWAPPALILSSGPLLWGSFSGMDLPVFTALALAFAADWPEEGRGPGWRLAVLGLLLGLARPDAVFLVLPAILIALARGNRGVRWLLPLGGVVLPFLLQWTLTGRPQSASMQVKSILATPGLGFGDWLLNGISYLQFVLKGVFGGGVVRAAQGVAANDGSAMGLYLFPFALSLLLLGHLPGTWAEWRGRRPGLHTLLFSWIVLLLLAQSFTVPRSWHWHRYLIPLYALAFPGISLALDRLGRGMETLWRELTPGDGPRLLALLAVLLSLPGAAFFTLAYGRNCADIRFQHIELAQRLNTELEGAGRLGETLVGVHDVGALTYFGDYRTLDLEGLASREFVDAARQGPAGIWEQIETLPPERRPQVLAVYASWFDPVFLGEHRLLFSQRQFRPSIAAGNPMNVYAANWSLANAAQAPADAEVLAEVAGASLLLAVDVAELGSESRAGYRFHPLDGAYEDLLLKRTLGAAGPVLEGGRLISGSERFTVKGVTPGRPLILVSRSHTPFRIRVEVNGESAGTWMSEGPGPGEWRESTFPIAGGLVTRPEATLELASDDPHHSAYGAFHYWVYQEKP